MAARRDVVKSPKIQRYQYGQACSVPQQIGIRSAHWNQRKGAAHAHRKKAAGNTARRKARFDCARGAAEVRSARNSKNKTLAVERSFDAGHGRAASESGLRASARSDWDARRSEKKAEASDDATGK